MSAKISALELDTGLHFFEGDSSIETLSSTLTDYSQKKEEEEIPHLALRKRVNSISSVESEKRNGVPDFRGWAFARAAIKAVDLMGKRGVP